MTRTAFVTGGTGFVGGAILARLVADGWSVRALARSEVGERSVREAGGEPVPGDLADIQALLSAMRGCDTVFNVAGVNRICVRDPAPMLAANVEGAAIVVRAAAAAGVRRVVHTSSAATIGERAGVVADEGSPHRGSFLSEYERSKFQGERRAFELGEELGIEVVSVNPSSVQGPGRTTGSALMFLRFVNSRMPAVVDADLSVVDLVDCTEAHVRAADRGVPGERYLVSGASLTTREAIEVVRKVAGRPRRVLRLPRLTVRAAGFAGSVAGRLGRDPPFCRELAATLLHGHRYDGSRASRELRISYTPIEDTVRRTLAWYAERGLAPPLPGTARRAVA